jgi:hypothetical protein
MQSPTSLNMLEAKGLQLGTLLQQLDENFPPMNPHPDNPINLIMYRSGQRSVVEWIQSQLSEN